MLVLNESNINTAEALFQISEKRFNEKKKSALCINKHDYYLRIFNNFLQGKKSGLVFLN